MHVRSCGHGSDLRGTGLTRQLGKNIRFLVANQSVKAVCAQMHGKIAFPLTHTRIPYLVELFVSFFLFSVSNLGIIFYFPTHMIA